MREYITIEEVSDFCVYSLPHTLFTEKFKGVSVEAKVLYSMFLCELQYFPCTDKNGLKYIFFNADDVMEKFGCSKQKAFRLLKELENAHLILRERRGRGLPDAIYVANCARVAREVL